MPQSREAIKHAPVSTETWRNNRTGVLWFDPRKIRPLGDHVLIELDPEKPPAGRLFIPEVAQNQEIGTRTGTVLAVGPGRWQEKRNSDLSWVLNPRVFKPTTLKPGDRVLIGHFSDWESWNCAHDGHQSRDRNIVLCQEADVRVYESAS
jgi:co-chaperonin GroES (HSP10)